MSACPRYLASAEPDARWRVVATWFGLALWVVAVALGSIGLWAYAARAGAPGMSPRVWPEDSALVRATDRPTFVVSVHTHCACSRATVGELAEIVGRAPEAARTYVILVAGREDGAVADGPVALAASSIPGVRVVTADAHRESLRFGAVTSGHAALFGPDGQLLFAGGITGARGHAGENEGRASILALLHGGSASDHTPVFGCPMGSEE